MRRGRIVIETRRASRESELPALRGLCDRATIIPEGDALFVHLSKLRFDCCSAVHTCDALLSPYEVAALGGYTTRLLLNTHPVKAGLNWTTVTALGSQWHTWSWQGIPSDWTLLEILSNHLKALA